MGYVHPSMNSVLYCLRCEIENGIVFCIPVQNEQYILLKTHLIST